LLNFISSKAPRAAQSNRVSRATRARKASALSGFIRCRQQIGELLAVAELDPGQLLVRRAAELVVGAFSLSDDSLEERAERAGVGPEALRAPVVASRRVAVAAVAVALVVAVASVAIAPPVVVVVATPFTTAAAAVTAAIPAAASATVVTAAPTPAAAASAPGAAAAAASGPLVSTICQFASWW